MKFLRRFFLVFLLIAPQAFAYSDHIGVSTDEVWQAAVQVFKPYGIHRSDESKKNLETNWMQDQVVRSRGLLKKIAKARYDRRYRLKFRVSEKAGGADVEIKGVFEEKPVDIGFSVPWKRVGGVEIDDADIEQDFFMKILRRMEKNRFDKL